MLMYISHFSGYGRGSTANAMEQHDLLEKISMWSTNREIHMDNCKLTKRYNTNFYKSFLIHHLKALKFILYLFFFFCLAESTWVYKSHSQPPKWAKKKNNNINGAIINEMSFLMMMIVTDKTNKLFHVS